jgi:hypothetical protein
LKHVRAINKEEYNKTLNQLCIFWFIIHRIKECAVQRLKYFKGLLNLRNCLIKLPEYRDLLAYVAYCLDKRQAWLKLYDCTRPQILSAGTLTRECKIYMFFTTGS